MINILWDTTLDTFYSGSVLKKQKQKQKQKTQQCLIKKKKWTTTFKLSKTSGYTSIDLEAIDWQNIVRFIFSLVI